MLVPKGSRTAFRDDPEHHRSVATLATRLCGKVFGFVKRNLSGAKRRMDAASEERGAGERTARPVPASAHRTLERDQRSEPVQFAGALNLMPLAKCRPQAG